MLQITLILLLLTTSCSAFSICGLQTDSAACESTSSWQNVECQWCAALNFGECRKITEKNGDPCKVSVVDTQPEVSSSKSSVNPSSLNFPFVSNLSSTSAGAVVEQVAKTLGLNMTQVDVCIHDTSATYAYLRNVESNLHSPANYTIALRSLSMAVASISTDLNDCGVPQAQTALDSLATALNSAKIKNIESSISKSVQIIVGTTDVFGKIGKDLVKAFQATDAAAVGKTIGALLTDWTSVENGCSKTNEACKLVDGFLRSIQLIATDFTSSCFTKLESTLDSFEAIVPAMKAHNVTQAFTSTAKGLDSLATALESDSCKLKNAAKIIENVLPALDAAKVERFDNSVTKIVVGSANVYDQIFQLAIALEKKDMKMVGTLLAKLVSELNASTCSNNAACKLISGGLSVLGVLATDLTKCEKDIAQSFIKMKDVLSEKISSSSASLIGDALSELADSVKDCGVSDIGTILENTANKFKANSTAVAIGDTVQVLVKGADLTLPIAQAAQDAGAERWTAVGSDLIRISQAIERDTSCTGFVCEVVELLLGESGTILGLADTCTKDIGASSFQFKQVGKNLKSKKYKLALKNLSTGVASISTAITDCKVSQLQTRLDTFAAALGLAKVKSVVDKDIQIIVGATDMTEKITKDLANALTADSTKDIGIALGMLLQDWSSLTNGCDQVDKSKFDIALAFRGRNRKLFSNNPTKLQEACLVVDGLLRAMQIVAEDVSGSCRTELVNALVDFENVATAIRQNKYEDAVSFTSKGLNSLATALKSDSCQLSNAAKVIENVLPAFDAAKVERFDTSVTKIVVGSANVYDQIFQLAIALEKKDMKGVGSELAKLLQELRASHCSNEACVLVEGGLAALGIVAADYKDCETDFSNAFDDLKDAFHGIKSSAGSWKKSISEVGDVLKNVAKGANDCDIKDLGKVMEDTATMLKANATTTVIGNVVTAIVDGSDVTLSLLQAANDASANRWAALGSDLTRIGQNLTSDLSCTNFVCKIVKGILDTVGIAMEDLSACEDSLKLAEDDFTNGAQLWKSKDHRNALSSFSKGISQVAKLIQKCGVDKELTTLINSAHSLGLSNVATKKADGTIAVLVHGVDLVKDIDGAVESFLAKDYGTTGKSLGKALDMISKWTSGHSCTSSVCYMVEGVFQAMSIVEGSVKTCENDLQHSWGNFTTAFTEFADSKESLFHWATHRKDPSSYISKGVMDLSNGFHLMAAAVKDCEVVELAELLEKLGAKLSLTPEVSVIEETVKIVLHGVEITEEISASCSDFANQNWVGFGYELAKLIKDLL
eukprot:g5711.t1